MCSAKPGNAWPPLAAQSGFITAFWWIACLNPPINLGLALVSGAQSMASAWVTIPLAMGALLAAPVLVIRAGVSTAMTPREKLITVLLGLSVFPMFGALAIAWWLGGHLRTASPVQVGGALSVLILWIVVMVAARSALRREPAS